MAIVCFEVNFLYLLYVVVFVVCCCFSFGCIFNSWFSFLNYSRFVAVSGQLVAQMHRLFVFGIIQRLFRFAVCHHEISIMFLLRDYVFH